MSMQHPNENDVDYVPPAIEDVPWPPKMLPKEVDSAKRELSASLLSELMYRKARDLAAESMREALKGLLFHPRDNEKVGAALLALKDYDTATGRRFEMTQEKP